MHLTGVETFQLPTREQILYLGLNGLIGTVSLEALGSKRIEEKP